MPVTARLSLKFYEKLGEEIAAELVEWFNSVDATYRADLRELNELNFARFDAKVEQRIGALEARIGQGLAEVRSDLRGEMADLRSDLRGEIGSLRQEMRDSIAALRAELIKWSFVFFATAALAVIGLR